MHASHAASRETYVDGPPQLHVQLVQSCDHYFVCAWQLSLVHMRELRGQARAAPAAHDHVLPPRAPGAQLTHAGRTRHDGVRTHYGSTYSGQQPHTVLRVRERESERPARARASTQLRIVVLRL